jgi:phage terminase Nu1 subunit (DNA packaging protein)
MTRWFDQGSEAHRLWPRQPERYVSARELAEIMGVSVATIKRMAREGMPSETWGRRTRRFRPSVAMAWASQQGAAREEAA